MRRTIPTINSHLGDESFVAMFGRMPTPYEDTQTRVAAHVGYASRLVRERDVSQLSHEQRARRTVVLDVLDDYVAAGQFPTSEADEGLLPSFLDRDTGARCAVAHLVETTAGTALMEAIDRDHHNAYISEIATDPRFLEWVAGSGLTVEELAWIQPSYPPPPPPEYLYVLAAAGQVAIAHDDPTTATRSTTSEDSPTTIGMLDLTLRHVAGHNPFVGKPTIEVGGGIGVTTGDHISYAAHALVGGEVKIIRDHLIAYDFGVALDAYGPAIPRAWTLPLDVSYHRTQGHTVYGIHAGPRIALDDKRDLDWNIGLDLRRKDLFCEEGRWDPRDLMIGVDVSTLAGATFIGLTVGVGNSRAHQWWED